MGTEAETFTGPSATRPAQVVDMRSISASALVLSYTNDGNATKLKTRAREHEVVLENRFGNSVTGTSGRKGILRGLELRHKILKVFIS